MKSVFSRFAPAVFAVALFAPLSAVQAETPEAAGLAIFQEADRRNEGFVDSVAATRMVLRDKQGEETDRQMKVKVLEGGPGEGDKSLMVFETPRDQKGTALLTYAHKQRDDDQWLYLPALKRVKKIVSKTRSGPFMGSEFSFEDVGGQDVEDYDYKWLRDEDYDGQACFVVESYPRDKNSGYTRIVSWIDKAHYRTLKSEFHDRKGTHLKTLTASGFKLYDNKYWRADLVEMVNVQTRKSTRLETRSLAFRTGLKPGDFTQNSLQRAR